MSTPEVTIIIPTFNEVGSIGELVHAISLHLPNTSYEILIVDDQSTDGTQAVAQQLAATIATVRYLPHPSPRGLASSVLYGIQNARGTIIVGMDADFNHSPSVLPTLIAPLQSKTADLVVASRFIPGGGMENTQRYIGTLLFNYVLKYIFSFPITDNTSGYYALKKRKLDTLPVTSIYRGYGEYHLRLVYAAKEMNWKIQEVPVWYPERKFGRSKSNLVAMLIIYSTVALLARCGIR